MGWGADFIQPQEPQESPESPEPFLAGAADVRDSAGRINYAMSIIKVILDKLPPEYDDALKSSACLLAAQVYGQAVGLDNLRRSEGWFRGGGR